MRAEKQKRKGAYESTTGKQAWIAAFADGERVEDKSCEKSKSASRTKTKEERHQLGLRHKQAWTAFLYSYSPDQRAQVEEEFRAAAGTLPIEAEADLKKMEAKVAKHQRKSQKDSSAFVP